MMESINEITTRLWITLRAWADEQDGASMVEYGLLLALIAVIAMGAFAVLGGNVSGTATNVANQVGSAN